MSNEKDKIREFLDKEFEEKKKPTALQVLAKRTGKSLEELKNLQDEFCRQLKEKEVFKNKSMKLVKHKAILLLYKYLGQLECPQCGHSGSDIKMVEDKSKVLSYEGHVPIYGMKCVCKKCGYEWRL
ncbi:MAG: hypothetical protein BAJALOKI2v1_70019 [Promethearchaeota archaeon]|nr:MAG: hypothetical protein BAJALOKI2v1_70019 [Candidatus Lokiarchaeota archaeon]